MKSGIFRPVSFWKSAIMTMPDHSFFELIRSVFGKIKTPFNKQQLLNDLENFLKRDDIKKSISAYIGENDAKIIIAVFLFGEATVQQLTDFFSDEYTKMQLQDIIVNLEERFILYRFTENKKNCLALNPVLKTILQPFTAETSALFPVQSFTKKTAITSALYLNDMILAALYSFILSIDLIYKAENIICKRALKEAKTIFPNLDLQQTLGALQVLGLFYNDSGRLVPEKSCLDAFSRLNAHERSVYCSAAFYIYNETVHFEILAPLYKNKIRDTVNLINGFINSLKTEVIYPYKTLKRIIEVLKAHTAVSFTTEALLNSLEKTGLILKLSPGKELYCITEPQITNKNADDNRGVIAIDSGSSVLVYPEIDFADAIKLASVLNIRETIQMQIMTPAPVIRFELDKDSIIRSFNNNIRADDIIKLLNRLSGNKTGETLIWNLKEWEKRYKEVSLKKGVILSLSEDQRYLAKTIPMANLIIETLAPGLYLLDEISMDEAANVLCNAGVEIIARPDIHRIKVNQSEFDKKSEDSGYENNYYPELRSAPETLKAIFTSVENNKNTDIYADNLKNNFLSILNKMSLNEAERTELSARIERRLILCETQLKDADIRFEKLEAKHMDYAGKQLIAKQAIAANSPLEIILLDKGKEKNVYGLAQSLEKENAELILYLNEDNNDSSQPLRIPLAKISLLRRIKKSIFV